MVRSPSCQRQCHALTPIQRARNVATKGSSGPSLISIWQHSFRERGGGPKTTHVTKPSSAMHCLCLHVQTFVRAAPPQDSLTNRNKLIAECSDSPGAGGVHELGRPKQQWDDEKNEGDLGYPQTPPWRRVLLEPVGSTHESRGGGCVEEGGPPRIRPRVKYVEAAHALHAGEGEMDTNRSRWCGG